MIQSNYLIDYNPLRLLPQAIIMISLDVQFRLNVSIQLWFHVL